MMEKHTNTIDMWITAHEAELVRTADHIFRHPETAYQEVRSSRFLAEFLDRYGFQIEWNTAGIATAFTAQWGSGRP